MYMLKTVWVCVGVCLYSRVCKYTRQVNRIYVYVGKFKPGQTTRSTSRSSSIYPCWPNCPCLIRLLDPQYSSTVILFLTVSYVVDIETSGLAHSNGNEHFYHVKSFNDQGFIHLSNTHCIQIYSLNFQSSSLFFFSFKLSPSDFTGNLFQSDFKNRKSFHSVSKEICSLLMFEANFTIIQIQLFGENYQKSANRKDYFFYWIWKLFRN